MTSTTRLPESTAGTLYVALELSAARWKVASTSGLGQQPRQVTIYAGDGRALLREIACAKQRAGVAAAAAVVSCYEAGRDGFWPHRWLTAKG